MLKSIYSPLRRIGILGIIVIAMLLGSATMLKSRQQHLQNAQDLISSELYIAMRHDAL